MVELQVLRGREIVPHIPDLARLRIAVFRDWPYLYDGDTAYETEYLRVFADCPRAVAVLAIDKGEAVGASTGMPLEDETDEVRAPFAAAGIAQAPIFYFSESVLLKPYRGTGLGVRFFEEREAHARALEFDFAYFCGVVRPTDHPARPAAYTPLDAFWQKRGYEAVPQLVAQFSWKDIGEGEESLKPLSFWRKRIRP